MRIFCPAMVASVPSLKPLLVEASRPPVFDRSSPVSDPRGRACRGRGPGSAPAGLPAVEALVGPWAPRARLRKRDASRDALPPGAARGGRDTLTEQSRPPATQPIQYAVTRTAM